jgi:hypothetical protein
MAARRSISADRFSSGTSDKKVRLTSFFGRVPAKAVQKLR